MNERACPGAVIIDNNAILKSIFGFEFVRASAFDTADFSSACHVHTGFAVEIAGGVGDSVPSSHTITVRFAVTPIKAAFGT